MAAKKKSTSTVVRDATAGPFRRAMLEELRADYLRRVESLAERLRPRFEAGELRGFNDEDSREDEEVRRAWHEAHPNAKRPTPPRSYPVTPSTNLYREMRRRLRLSDPRTALLVLAASPSGVAVMQIDTAATLESHAGEAALWDVLRIARARRWYKPGPGEEPSAEDLAVAEVRP